jgi:hypothetical protein
MTTTPEGDEPAIANAEPRWPMALAVLAAIVLTLLLPEEVRFLPRWVMPLLEGGLLLAVVITDPGSIDRRDRGLRALSLGLVSLLMLGALVATVLLVDELLTKGSITNSAGELLRAGAIVWLGTNLAFSLLYWQLDGGGSAERAISPRKYPDLAVPQNSSPHLAPPNWRPQYVDYFYLAFTNSTAFSPTDVMPLAPWAKLTMTLQSLISLAILALVIAVAVNVLS